MHQAATSIKRYAMELGGNALAVAMANDTLYGLAAYIYTTNLNTAMKRSREIDAGDVLVNELHLCYNLPHGGCKRSRIGKDCSVFSLEEYFYLQRISIKL